jgi:NAD(P)-dependent dehydrogenase (short-subunit alcohol dehydrogenase family)
VTDAVAVKPHQLPTTKKGNTYDGHYRSSAVMFVRGSGVCMQGKRVLLTGASSGIGRALAAELAARGALLVLAARRADLLEELAEEIAADGHRRPEVIPADLSEPGAAQALATAALSALDGSLDVLINNAGASLTGAQSMIGDMPDARAVFEVNLWSPLALTAAVVPVMRTAGAGIIVNVTSTVRPCRCRCWGITPRQRPRWPKPLAHLGTNCAKPRSGWWKSCPDSPTPHYATSTNCHGRAHHRRLCLR